MPERSERPVADRPHQVLALAHRGVVEGFYGPPWSHQDRLDHLRFSAEHGLNSYVYAPKDDPYHRALWREPYPDDRLALLAELAQEAERNGVRFVYGIAPGLTMRLDDPADQEVLHRKAAQLWDAGVRHFALLFDDLPAELTADRLPLERPTEWLGARHGAVCRAFAEGFLAPRGVHEPLPMVPTDYAGTQVSAYRTGLATTLPETSPVWWTGSDIVVGSVSEPEVTAAAAAFDRPLLLWDNFPVNDFDPSRAFLGPLVGRSSGAAHGLVGLHANPMASAVASRLALATVAEYAWDPDGYDPDAAAERALAAVAGPDADALRPLVRACSTWPPDVAGDEELTTLAERMLGPDRAAAHAATLRWRERMAALAQMPPGQGRLAEELRPWSHAGAAMGAAGCAAADLLLATLGRVPGDARRPLEARARDALDRAERHYPNVLRGLVPPLVRALLPAAGDDPVTDEPWALLVTGRRPTAGEEQIEALLHRHGLRVRRAPDGCGDPRLVVVLPGAGPDEVAAAAALPHPLLAAAHPVTAGLAVRTGVVHRETAVTIVAPDHALADGRSGRVVVHEGPAMARWTEPGPDAVVVAVAEEEHRPVLVHHPQGARLTDGGTAPADRVTTHLGPDGLAPWLTAPAGLALVDAAVAFLLGGAAVR
ncbi:protein O-GlcNAcase [Cellulomonas sp. 73-145]|uniref:protein O-GlcNAcase n=1 Tax=Cellulomonas sp. 73-145 TaxID=1895739 RepID=UPI0025C045B8|nr:protein O-GlcNAcase [Cellulomonas sp. 73-145]